MLGTFKPICSRKLACGQVAGRSLGLFGRSRICKTAQIGTKIKVYIRPFRYRITARHYRVLADREERSDKARMAEHLELLKLKRRKKQQSRQIKSAARSFGPLLGD